MVFENIISEEHINFHPTDRVTKVRIDLEPKRENELQKINKAYSKLVFNNAKRLGRVKVIKLAIDNLLTDLDKLDDKEQLEYLRALYKEAEF